MRKRLKSKRRSCPLCKPHKTGGSNRWPVKEHEAIKRFEREEQGSDPAWEDIDKEIQDEYGRRNDDAV